MKITVQASFLKVDLTTGYPDKELLIEKVDFSIMFPGFSYLLASELGAPSVQWPWRFGEQGAWPKDVHPRSRTQW